MSVITLLTDYGIEDHYVASIKGILISQIPSSTIVDISHSIKPNHIQDAAFVLKNCYHHFPKGTVHYIGVNETSGQGDPDQYDKLIAVQFDGHYFVGSDNGLISLILNENNPTIAVVIDKDPKGSFPGKNQLLPAVIHLSKGGDISELGWPIDALKKARTTDLSKHENSLKGAITHVDHYGNLITNIDQESFTNLYRKRKFEISFERQKVKIIHNTYSDVENGHVLCFFNDAGFLEIAINTGNAQKLFNLGIGQDVHINFTPKPSL